MQSYPNRCQHIKVNGTQCGSPALRRNRFCFFHKRFQDESIRLATDRKRNAPATFVLPVLEDANSVQIALMQVMRLLVTGQIEHKTASLLLYALQTASSNLRMTEFKPRYHNVILDPRDAANNALGGTDLWEDDDFLTEEDIDAEERSRISKEEADRRDNEKFVLGFIRKYPGYCIVNTGKELKVVVQQPAPKPKPAQATPASTSAPASPAKPAEPAAPEKKPAASAPKIDVSKIDVNALTRKVLFPTMPDEVYESAVKALGDTKKGT